MIILEFHIIVTVVRPTSGGILTSATFNLLHGPVQTTVLAASFNEIANGPVFPGITWVTATYYADAMTLSAYGYEAAVDHRLTVTELDVSDEKRLIEVIAAFGIVTENAALRVLRTRRFYFPFTRPHLSV